MGITGSTIKIYPDALAAMRAPDAGQRYEPSNGTEGEVFWSRWCAHCERDRVMNGTVEWDIAGDQDHCQILGASMADGGVAEWVIADDGQPKCTAFVSAGDPIPAPACEYTGDLFA